MQHFKGFVGACLLAALVSGCAGQSSSVMPADPPTSQQANAISQSPLSTDAADSTTQATDVTQRDQSNPTIDAAPETSTAAASTDALSTAALTTNASSVPRHVMTVDYLGTPFGTTAVSPSRAAPYLSWAETGVNNTNSMTAVGMRTLVYVDANRQESRDPLAVAGGEGAFAHSCSSSRIHDYHDHVIQYLMEPGSYALRTAYATYVRVRSAGHTVTAMFQDDSVAPSAYYAGFFSPSLPCGYTLSRWQSAQRGLQASINHDTILNGLASNTTWPLLDNPSTIGGNYEGCFDTNGTHHYIAGQSWINAQKLQAYVTGRGKYFECMALDTTPAVSAIRGRLYNIASFLMTYVPSRSMLWETYYTPSRVHVMPESQLIPTSPIESNNITYLRRSSGVYMRQYRACYYAGRSIGPCAMVVNSDSVTHSRPSFSYAFRHTMALHGYGILDGGTATFNGSAPGSLGGESAYVAVP